MHANNTFSKIWLYDCISLLINMNDDDHMLSNYYYEWLYSCILWHNEWWWSDYNDMLIKLRAQKNLRQNTSNLKKWQKN